MGAASRANRIPPPNGSQPASYVTFDTAMGGAVHGLRLAGAVVSWFGQQRTLSSKNLPCLSPDMPAPVVPGREIQSSAFGENPMMERHDQSLGLRDELRMLVRRFVQVWALVPRKHKKVLALAALLLALTSASSTAIALVLGMLVDAVTNGIDHRADADSLYKIAAAYLGAIAIAYLLREGLTTVRRCLVETTCARISRDMSIRLMSHLLRVSLTTLGGDQVGALHGRIFRSVGGYVRFLRLAFLDCLPAVFVGLFALAAATTKQPLLGLVMLGVIPMSVWLTIRQLVSQKGVRLALNQDCEDIDGAVVEQLSGIEYLRRRPKRGANAKSSTIAKCPCTAAPRPSTRDCFMFSSWPSRSFWRFRDVSAPAMC
jgi:ABC transporter transmembrane region